MPKRLLPAILKHGIFRPRATAIVDDQRTWTSFQLTAAAFLAASHIREQTDAKHVGLLLPTSGMTPMMLLGTWILGRVPVPLNYLLPPNDLTYVLDDADIDTVFTVGPMLEHLGHTDDNPVIPERFNVVKLEDLNFKKLPRPRWPHRADPNDLAVLLYTSGTSGKPKGVMLSHGNLAAEVYGGIEHSGLQRCDGFLGVLPQFHSFGLSVLTLVPLTLGAPVIYTARFIPKKLVDLIRKHRPHVFMGVPSMYNALLSVKNATPEDFDSIILPVSGGEPLPDAVYERCLDELGLELLEGYGLTETSPGTHWCTPGKKRRHSVGSALPGVETYILGDDGDILGPNEDGEIVLAGPLIMLGYYKKPELTDEVVFSLNVPGRSDPVRAFRTGDIGRLDDDGYLYITGRKKEMLIISGENVFPREIEEVLNKHPAVHASAVVGQKDPSRGEVAIAFAELNEGESAEPAALRQHCRDALPPFKVPREVRLIDSLPRNPTGKIMRRVLAEQLADS